MSGSIGKGMVGDKTALGEFAKHDIHGGMWTPPARQAEASTLQAITRVGSWCIYDASRFCQETRCNDCAICENNK